MTTLFLCHHINYNVACACLWARRAAALEAQRAQNNSCDKIMKPQDSSNSGHENSVKGLLETLSGLEIRKVSAISSKLGVCVQCLEADPHIKSADVLFKYNLKSCEEDLIVETK